MREAISIAALLTFLAFAGSEQSQAQVGKTCHATGIAGLVQVCGLGYR